MIMNPMLKMFLHKAYLHQIYITVHGKKLPCATFEINYKFELKKYQYKIVLKEMCFQHVRKNIFRMIPQM